MTSCLAGLRAATRDIHERLHLHPAFAPLTSESCDLPGYCRLLARLHGFHAPVEQWAFAAAERLLPELDDLPERRKAGKLLADLDSIAHGAWDRPASMTIGGNLTRPQLLGTLYVIEGATLGGRELGRRLTPMLEPLGLHEPVGRQFLLTYGELQGVMWRRFCAVLDAAALSFTPAELADMEAAARALFLRLDRWLSDN